MLDEARIKLLEELQKSLEKGKGYSITSMYNRYCDLGGQTSK
jgi:hypothetical protein